MFQSACDFVCSIDFISAEVQLRTFGQTRFKTVFGGLISFGMFVMVVVLTLYFSNILVFRTLVSTSGMDVTNLEPILFGISGLIQFEFVDSEGIPFNDWEKYLVLKGYIVSDTSATLIGDKLRYNEQALIKCHGDIPHEFSAEIEFINNEYLCFENSNIPLYGSIGQNLRSKYLSLVVQKNTTSTTPSALEELNAKITDKYLVIKYLDYEFNHFNSSSGKQNYLRYNVFPVLIEDSVLIQYQYKKTIYNNDLHWFYFNGIDDEFYMIDRTAELQHKTKSLYTINFMMSSIKTINKRYYTKMQDVLSNIGGVLEIFVFVFATIQHYLTARINYLSIANQIIRFGSVESKGDRMNSPNIESKKTKRRFAFYDEDSTPKVIISSTTNNNINNINNYIYETNGTVTPVGPPFKQNNIEGNALEKLNENINNNNNKDQGDLTDKQSHVMKGMRSEVYNSPNVLAKIPVSFKRRSGNQEKLTLKRKGTQISPLLRLTSSIKNGKGQKKSLMSLFSHQEKQKDKRFKIESTEGQISLTIKEFLCDRFCFRKSRNINLLSKAAKYIDEKISIEFILKKLNEIDKMKFVLFDRDELNLFNILPNPNFEEIFNYDHNNSNQTENLREIDNLWRLYEFYQPNEIEENESYNKIIMKSKQKFRGEQLIKFLSVDVIEEDKSMNSYTSKKEINN